nr:hypothetical protein [uncultured Acidovorax sp.]
MQFESVLDYYEAIANELQRLAPWLWSHVKVEAERYGSSIDLQVVYISPTGTRESDVDPVMLPDYFFELAERVSTPEKGLYRKCLFSLKADGTFDVQFEY